MQIDQIVAYLTEHPEEASVALEAFTTTRMNRQMEYGHPVINFYRFGTFLADYLRMEGLLVPGTWITPRHVAWIMVLTKVARDIETDKRDNWVDTAGYADCLGRMDQWMRDKGYRNGIAAFRTMTEAECALLMEEPDVAPDWDSLIGFYFGKHE